MRHILISTCLLLFVSAHKGSAQLTLTARPFSLDINGNIINSGYASVTIDPNYPKRIINLSWTGPNNYWQGNFMAYPLWEEGEYCLLAIDEDFCVAKACIWVPKCQQYLDIASGLITTSCAYPKKTDPPAQPKTGFNISNGAIYPNPFDDIVNVSLESPIEGNVSIKVIDLTGRVLLEKRGEVVVGENLFEVNIPYVLSGTYFIHVTGPQGNTFTKKVVRR